MCPRHDFEMVEDIAKGCLLCNAEAAGESVKRQARALVASGKHKAFVAGLLNVSLSTIRRWCA